MYSISESPKEHFHKPLSKRAKCSPIPKSSKDNCCISNMQNDIKNIYQCISTMQEQIRLKDQEICELKEEISYLKQDIANLEERLSIPEKDTTYEFRQEVESKIKELQNDNIYLAKLMYIKDPFSTYNINDSVKNKCKETFKNKLSSFLTNKGELYLNDDACSLLVNNFDISFTKRSKELRECLNTPIMKKALNELTEKIANAVEKQNKCINEYIDKSIYEYIEWYKRNIHNNIVYSHRSKTEKHNLFCEHIHDDIINNFKFIEYFINARQEYFNTLLALYPDYKTLYEGHAYRNYNVYHQLYEFDKSIIPSILDYNEFYVHVKQELTDHYNNIIINKLDSSL